MVAHMENTSVAEALAHTLGADELSATLMAPPDLAWIGSTHVLQVHQKLSKQRLDVNVESLFSHHSCAHTCACSLITQPHTCSQLQLPYWMCLDCIRRTAWGVTVLFCIPNVF